MAEQKYCLSAITKKKLKSRSIHKKLLKELQYEELLSTNAVQARNCHTMTESTPVVQWLSYSLLDPRFTGSIPVEVDAFFRESW